MYSKFNQWSNQQQRMDAYQKAEQKSLRISEATTGKKKQRKPENKGKHRQTDKKIVVNKSGLSATSVRTANKGNVDVDINIIKTGNRKGQGRPPASAGTGSRRRGNTLNEAFGFRDTTTNKERERTDRNERDRIERQDRLDREQREARERARDRARQREIDEQNRRRENTRLMIERERLQLERQIANAPRPAVAPAPANHPDDIGRGIAEMNARIDRLDANVRAGQNIAPPPINVEVNPNIRVVGVERGGIVINNEGARAVANNRGRRANIGRRGGGNLSSESSSSEGFSSPAEEQRAIARRPPASRRRETQRRRSPTAPAERPVSSSESSVLVDRPSGSERDEPSLAQRGASALISGGGVVGGAVARGVGAGLSTIGERAVSALPSAEDVGGVVGGAVATGVGIIGRGAVSLGQRAYENLPPAEDVVVGAQNLLAEAIQQPEQREIEADPALLQSVSEGESSSPEEGVSVAPQQPVGTLLQRIRERNEAEREEFRREEAERERQRRLREEERTQRLEKAEQSKQSGILADIQSGIQTGVNILRDAITAPSSQTQRKSTPAPLGLGEEPSVRRGSVGSGVELLSDYFDESGESDTSYTQLAEGGSAFGSGSDEGLLETRKTGRTPKPPKERTLTKKDLEDPFVVLEQSIKTRGDLGKEGDTPPSSPESLRLETNKPQPEPEGNSDTDTDTEEKFRDLSKLSPKQLLRTGERLQRQQIKADSLLSEALKEPQKVVVGQRGDSPSDTESSSADESSESQKDFFGQRGDLGVSGFGTRSSGTESSSESEGETIAQRRKRERATIRREQLRRGVSKEEADRLSKIGTRYLGESSSDESGEEQNQKQQRIMTNQQFIAKLEKSLELLTLQKARKSGMGQEAKTQYERNITEHQRVLGLLRGQNSIILEGKPYGSLIINNDSPLIQTSNRIIGGEELVSTKGGTRAGSGRPVVKVSENPEIQSNFEGVIQRKTGNVRLLNDRLSQFRLNRADSAITTRDRGTLERFLRGRASTEQIEEILRIYDDILENKRLERLYRKGDRG